MAQGLQPRVAPVELGQDGSLGRRRGGVRMGGEERVRKTGGQVVVRRTLRELGVSFLTHLVLPRYCLGDVEAGDVEHLRNQRVLDVPEDCQ